MTRRFPGRRRGARVSAVAVTVVAALAASAEGATHRTWTRGAATPAREVHFTFSGDTAVTFDWVGSGRTIRYGRTSRYTNVAAAYAPTPSPFSSAGPFREARLAGLKLGRTYHYSIAGGPDQTFSSLPTGAYRFDVEADVGDSGNASHVGPTQSQIAADKPLFVVVAGDLTYGNANGQAAVDRHFDDVMAWSRGSAYMPAWGNHEWDESADDLRNYKGRFALPHPHSSPGAPAAGCCGEDWGWFDAGPVRFISYPEPYSNATWADWRTEAGRIMAAAEASRRIKFIVTYGHRPAYSSGYHPGDPTLASILDGFGDTYSKYVLNLNGHSHDYERFRPIHHVIHVTAGGGGSSLEPPWRGADPRTAYRAMHLAHLRISVTPRRISVETVCGPATSADDISCAEGAVIDSFTIAAPASSHR
jgi:Calcineurin-like phosphoesterase